MGHSFLFIVIILIFFSPHLLRTRFFSFKFFLFLIFSSSFFFFFFFFIQGKCQGMMKNLIIICLMMIGIKNLYVPEGKNMRKFQNYLYQNQVTISSPLKGEGGKVTYQFSLF